MTVACVCLLPRVDSFTTRTSRSSVHSVPSHSASLALWLFTEPHTSTSFESNFRRPRMLMTTVYAVCVCSHTYSCLFTRAMLYIGKDVSPSVCPSRSSIISKRHNLSPKLFHRSASDNPNILVSCKRLSVTKLRWNHP